MKNHLQEGTGNLQGAEVVFDENIPAYNCTVKRGNWFPNNSHPTISQGHYHTPRRRITTFKNPDLVLIITTHGWFDVNTKAQLLTLENYQKRHKEFLQEMGNQGFIRGKERAYSVLQDLVDREEEIFERIMANYQVSLEHSTK